MKYYSEILKKYYDTADECEKAELELQEKEERSSKEKKQLAKIVEEASTAVEAATERYEVAKKEANEIIAKARKEAIEYLEPFKAEVEQAQKDRYNAISDFNSKYGNYTRVYTGSEAYKQMERALKEMNNIFSIFG